MVVVRGADAPCVHRRRLAGPQPVDRRLPRSLAAMPASRESARAVHRTARRPQHHDCPGWASHSELEPRPTRRRDLHTFLTRVRQNSGRQTCGGTGCTGTAVQRQRGAHHARHSADFSRPDLAAAGHSVDGGGRGAVGGSPALGQPDIRGCGVDSDHLCANQHRHRAGRRAAL